MRTKLRQIYYDLRHQPVIAWVTFLATALTIYLFVIFSMKDTVTRVAFAPESCRNRLLVGVSLHISADTTVNWSEFYECSGYMSFSTARRMYGGLEGIDQMSVAAVDSRSALVSTAGGRAADAEVRKTDANFFNVFDHSLLRGRYYSEQEADAGVKVAVITESVARRLFGDAEAVGSEMLISYIPYRVIGVIADHSRFATQAAGDVFVPVGPKSTDDVWEQYFGDYGAFMTMKPGVSRADIQRQVAQRYNELSSELRTQGHRAVYHEAPYDIDVIAAGEYTFSNGTPRSGVRTEVYVIYAILLLIPSINLSAMLQSRMRRRVSEIGVRRAYGCTRRRVFIDIIVENMFITLAGALLGLALAVITALCYGSLFDGIPGLPLGTRPPLSAVLSWQTVGIGLGGSVALNLLAASVPALRAARINPVQAINATK